MVILILKTSICHPNWINSCLVWRFKLLCVIVRFCALISLQCVVVRCCAQKSTSPEKGTPKISIKISENRKKWPSSLHFYVIFSCLPGVFFLQLWARRAITVICSMACAVKHIELELWCESSTSVWLGFLQSLFCPHGNGRTVWVFIP